MRNRQVMDGGGVQRGDEARSPESRNAEGANSGSGHGYGKEERRIGLIPHRSARARSVRNLVTN